MAVLKDLLPCPFCETDDKLGWYGQYQCRCGRCGTIGPDISVYVSRAYNYSDKACREGVAMLWNARTPAEWLVATTALKNDPAIMKRRLADPQAKPAPKGRGKKGNLMWAVCIENVATFTEGVEYKVSKLPEDPNEEIRAIDDDSTEHTLPARYFKEP